MLTRRSFIAAASAAMAAPLLTQAIQAQTAAPLRVRALSALTSLDPIWTTAYVTRNHAYLVFDTLFGMDENLVVRPQMVSEYGASDDGLAHTFVLRDGLAFHDGSPVTADDCIASIRRWMARDNMGGRIKALLGDITATDEKSFTLTLTAPFSMLTQSLAKAGSNVCFIMPARIAATDPSEQVTEMVGSGPFRFVTEEYVPDARAVYVRNDDYVPRDEPASGTAGGKLVKIDRLEMLFMDDMAATSAIQSREIDFYEEPSPELLPVLQSAPGVVLSVTNTIGMQMVIRPNHTAAPFDNPVFRRAFMRLINPEEHMLAYLGDPNLFTIDGSVYPVGTPYNTDQGAILHDADAAAALLAESGYNGETIYVLQATNIATNRIFSTVTAEQLRRAGINVQIEASDFGTMFARALKNDPVESGNGWHLIHFANLGTDMADPITSRSLSGGADYLGWSTDEEIEKMRAAFLAEADLEARKVIAGQIQERALDLGFYYPGGSFMQPNAHLDNVTDLVTAPVPVFWNVTHS